MSEVDEAQLKQVLATLQRELEPHRGKGKVANYIPALARIDPRKFGLSVTLVNGRTFSLGDAAEAFSIQSISKVFALTLALETENEALWQRVGREPSGSAFNSIVQLEQEHGIPRNPFINAGAIVVSDIVLNGRTPDAAIAAIVHFLRFATADSEIYVDREVATSEHATGHRNRALAQFMKSFGNIHHTVEDALTVYFSQCAIAMSCIQLSKAGLFLVRDGYCPLNGQQIISAPRARRLKALMLTCGHYDASGEFAYLVGLPGKSGVGGGILCIVPGIASIAAWSPGLNTYGNSLLGSLAMERLAQAMNWNVF